MSPQSLLPILNIRNWEDVSRSRPSMIALGNFDGVHLGHRQVLDLLAEESRKSDLDPVLVTFEPHPRYYFKPNEKASLLTTPDEKALLLAQWPMELIFLRFGRSLAELEPEEFVEEFLKKKLLGQRFILGHDHRFGKRARGNVELLETHVPNPGENILAVKPFTWEGEIVSSSTIRSHLEKGRMERANQFLGRPFFYTGTVIHGDGRGGQLGFETANIEPNHPWKVLPAFGVYGGALSVGKRELPCIINIGTNPTFKTQKTKIEAHVLDFQEDIYGQNVQLKLFFHLRKEKKFRSISELRHQIISDISDCRVRLALFPISPQKTQEFT